MSKWGTGSICAGPPSLFLDLRRPQQDLNLPPPTSLRSALYQMSYGDTVHEGGREPPTSGVAPGALL